jgi:hypothetical protein
MELNDKNVVIRIPDLAMVVLMLICMATCGSPDLVDGITHQLMTKCEVVAK